MTRQEWEELKVGDKVVAIQKVYDLPPDKSQVHAELGDEGVVVNAEPEHRTVRFSPKETCTDVFWEEVDRVKG